MRASIMDAPHSMRVGTWEVPQIGSEDVLVQVKAAGLCAGDMYFYLGKNPYAQYPQICGHEIAGIVAEVGPAVTDLEVGTAVVVEPFVGCGTCYPCRVGKSNCCANLQIIGVHRPGGYAEYVTAPATHIHRVPANMSMTRASFVEPLAIGVQSCRRGEVTTGEQVLVLGCGPIGLAIIEVALARGASVLAVDTLPTRLETAASLGAEPLPAGEHLLQMILDKTNGEGMPVVIEATGNARVMEQTVELVAAGGRIVIVGLVPAGIGVTFPGLDYTRKEMTVVGSRASVNCFPEALELLASNRITYPNLATEFSLWDAPNVFATLAKDPAAVHKSVFLA
ncbi:L-galactonate-5-dehydrogenase [Dictyobacter alpinus]|uniref:L-galactonate-5-dehydrogenase n=1 Tax=Dictyobacter alpinus TaxID=2014873 RepID=A0A402BEK2_9CHLR|nr:zinc-binding alcohol dehydrogenase family protein [Dictyobacter alpinus]GCE29814.1 L-galactonate-5-dehydrogenase [Dictyobacter alpinus]